MRKFALSILAVVVMVLSIPSQSVTHAQGEAPWIISSTMPVEASVKNSIEAWLGENAPVPVTYWAITYVQPMGGPWLVSIVGLDLQTPDEDWNLSEIDKVAWMGTVKVNLDTSVTMYSSSPKMNTDITYVPKFLLMPFDDGTGGGSHLRFPWQTGRTMMFGPRGVHDAGGGGWYAQGFLAVDFLGGDDMGSGVASNKTYAVTTGEVDFICADQTLTFRTHKAVTDEYYIYAHIKNSVQILVGKNYKAGEYIGKLIYGDFDDDCGYAEQKDNHYHLHFGFQPSGTFFRIDDCVLKTSLGKWTCGTKTIGVGQFLLGGGGNGGGGDDGTGGGGNNQEDGGVYSIDQPSFWDYIVVGAVSMWEKMVLKNMPDHKPLKYTEVLYSGVKLAIKITRVMIYSNVDLGPLMACVLLGLAIRTILGVAEFIMFLFKAWKSLVPILGA